MKISLQSIYNWYRQGIRNPKYRWWFILGTLTYLVLPFDLAPDFLPILGEIDDLVLVTLLLTEVSRLVIDTFKSRQKTPVSNNQQGETVDVNAVSLD
jgi:uncharacterized membrane protein YkvA (DUF1232 family)